LVVGFPAPFCLPPASWCLLLFFDPLLHPIIFVFLLSTTEFSCACKEEVACQKYHTAKSQGLGPTNVYPLSLQYRFHKSQASVAVTRAWDLETIVHKMP
jgi:hypothetical protein